jgi:hypothetical protein
MVDRRRILMTAIIALFFGAGLTLSAIAGTAIFAAAALHVLRSAWRSTEESLDKAAARVDAARRQISQPRPF